MKNCVHTCASCSTGAVLLCGDGFFRLFLSQLEVAQQRLTEEHQQCEQGQAVVLSQQSEIETLQGTVRNLEGEIDALQQKVQDVSCQEELLRKEVCNCFRIYCIACGSGCCII